MHKILFLFLLLFSSFAYAQNDAAYEVEEADSYQDNYYDYEYDYNSVANDTIIYNKSTQFSNKRDFASDIASKYTGKEFEYLDDLKKPKAAEQQVSKDIDTSGADAFLQFMSTIFPYLIGLVIVLIVLKTFVNVDSKFWKFGKSTKKNDEKLIHEDDENISDTDYEALLTRAIQHSNYRLATRYYYLSSLKKLSQKELIKYDKDKTNTEYQFELKNKELRTKFSYLAYIYDYVWYGEFPVDQVQFNIIENNYKSFIRVI